MVEGGMRFLRLAEAGQTVSQQATIGLRKILQEVSTASQGTLEVSSVPQEHLTFLSPNQPEGGPSGYSFIGSSMEWKKWVSIFQDGSQLVKVENELATYVTDPATVTAPDFATGVQTWPRRRPLANNVLSIKFSLLNPAVVRVEIVTSVATGTSKTTDLQIASSIRLLNE